MMVDLPINDEQFSLLADGELAADEFGIVLLKVLADDGLRQRLREHLLLRQQFRPWREQTPEAQNSMPIEPAHSHLGGPMTQQPAASKWSALRPLGAAAALGGILAWGAMLVFQASKSTQPAERVVTAETAQENEAVGALPAHVSSEQQQQVEDVFAFYESVTGPLKSYVDTEGTIAVEALPGKSGTQRATPGKPIAIVIRFFDPSVPGSHQTESLVVVRENVPIKVSLPNSSDLHQPDVYVIPSRTNGAIDVRYAISMPTDKEHRSASIAGWKTVGLQETSLGGLALGDRSVQITASAWALK